MGWRRGWNRGCWNGYGYGYGWGAPWAPYAYADPYQYQPTPFGTGPGAEAAYLDSYARQLEDELARVKARIEELKKQSGKG